MKNNLLRDSKGMYVFVDLTDLSAEIIPEPDYGYFSLIAAAFDKTSFITYKTILDNYEAYFTGLMVSAFENGDKRESEVLYQRYGLSNGIRKTLNEVGRNLNLSQEYIRQIEANALSRVRHPNNGLDVIFYEKNSDQSNWYNSSEIDYANIFENLLKLEMRSRKPIDGNTFYLVFDNIINSIRFKPIYDEQSLSEADFADARGRRILKSYGILTVREVLDTPDNEIKEMQSMDCWAFRRIKRYKTALNMKRYSLNDNSAFEDQEQTLITRTNLPASRKLDLLRRGFLFVSDFIEFYDFIETPKKRPDHGFFLNNNYHLLKSLLPYSQPVLCVKMSKMLQKEILKKQSLSVNSLKQNRCLFNGKLLKELDQFLLEVDNATQTI